MGWKSGLAGRGEGMTKIMKNIIVIFVAFFADHFSV